MPKGTKEKATAKTAASPKKKGSGAAPKKGSGAAPKKGSGAAPKKGSGAAPKQAPKLSSTSKGGGTATKRTTSGSGFQLSLSYRLDD